MTELSLNAPITSLYGVGSSQAKKYSKLNIFTVRDLLFHIPFRDVIGSFKDISVIYLTNY